MQNNRLGDALMGLGAGFQGQGVQFAQQQANQQAQQAQAQVQDRQMSLEEAKARRKSFFTDMVQLNGLVKSGRLQDAHALLTNRRQHMTTLGSKNSRDTDNLLKLTEVALSGKPEAQSKALSLINDTLSTNIEMGVQLGDLKAAKDPDADFNNWKRKKDYERENPDPMTAQEKIALKGTEATIANIQSQMAERAANRADKREAEAAKREAAEKASSQAIENKVQTAGNVIDAVDSALGRIGFSTTGFVGEQMKGVGGTEAYALEGDLETIKANLSFDRLQQMREASKSGGALGSIAVKELDMLGAVMTNLRQGLNGKDLEKNLLKVREHYGNAVMALQGVDPYKKAEEKTQPTGGYKVLRRKNADS